jgi:hypothetical protein
MSWSKENLKELYWKTFGFELKPDELEIVWTMSQNEAITPIGDQMNIAASPAFIANMIGYALERTGLPLEDGIFKKVRQELFPAIVFVLFLKKIGLGEHLITLSDAPDIVLIKKNDYRPSNGKGPKVRGVPLEITSLNETAFTETHGSTPEEQAVDSLSKKLTRAYTPHATLLVIIDANVERLDLAKISSLLKAKSKNFNQVYFYGRISDALCRMTRVYPDFAAQDLDPATDLDPMTY